MTDETAALGASAPDKERAKRHAPFEAASEAILSLDTTCGKPLEANAAAVARSEPPRDELRRLRDEGRSTVRWTIEAAMAGVQPVTRSGVGLPALPKESSAWH